MIRPPRSSPLFPTTPLSLSFPADVLELVVAASLHGVLRAEDRVDRRSQGLRAVDHKQVFPVRFHAAPHQVFQTGRAPPPHFRSRLRPGPARACAPRGPRPSPPAPDDRRTAPRRRKSPAVRSGPSGARTACAVRPRWPPPLPGSRSTATRPPSLPSAATPSRIVESRLLAAEFPASGSPASRPP